MSKDSYSTSSASLQVADPALNAGTVQYTTAEIDMKPSDLLRSEPYLRGGVTSFELHTQHRQQSDYTPRHAQLRASAVHTSHTDQYGP